MHQQQNASSNAPALTAPPPPADDVATQLAMEMKEMLRMLCCAAATNGPTPRQSTLHCMAVFEGCAAHVTRTSLLLTSMPAGGGVYLHNALV
jgi:hypothetical protein